MEKNARPLQGIMAAIGLLILIFDSSLALEGARAGIELCIKTVVPSLFPFFVLSMAMTNGLVISPGKPVQIATGLLGIPATAASIFLPAFLGGYPVGAKCVGDFYQQNQISKGDAERMLAFCSNVGPSFLFGMVSCFFPERKFVWLLWLIHLSSAILTAFSLPVTGKISSTSHSVNRTENQPVILSSARAICLVCCWVILFRILITFLNQWFFWALPLWMQVFLMGILELTNGCCSLMLIADVRARFVLCACILAFGGICVLLQTISVTKGLSVRSYVKGKLLQTLYSFLLSCVFVSGFRLYLAPLIPILVIFLRKTQNRYGNPRAVPV